MSPTKGNRANDAFSRLASAHQAKPVPGGEALATTTRPTAPAGGLGDPIRRFTVRFYDYSDTDALDGWLSTARKVVGSKIDASRLVRELVRELANDTALSTRIHARLREEEQPAGD